MKLVFILRGPACLSLTFGIAVIAEAPRVFAYQGRLAEDTGELLDVGLFAYAFGLFDRIFASLYPGFLYQSTVIGEFAAAIISEEIRNNQFGILTDRPYIKVSWQVTGIRNDKSALFRKTKVEIDKPKSERGTYVNLQAFGVGKEMGKYNLDHPRRLTDRENNSLEKRHSMQGRRERSER